MQGVDARQAFEGWARWRVGGVTTAFQQMSSLTGRLMDGMRSTTCPDCKGEGRIPGHRVGSQLAWIDPCPTCLGAKRVKGDLHAARSIKSQWCAVCWDEKAERSTGEVNGRTCAPCRGSGWRVRVQLEVNPAGIKGTRYYGVNEDPDPASMCIDRLVATWSRTEGAYWVAMYRVVMAEYCCIDPRSGRTCAGTQEAKAAALNMRRQFFSRMLTDAHQRAQEALEKEI